MRPALFAFAVASAFFGAALYINLVEQPARLALHVRSMIREWIPSNRRGFIMLATLAIISAVLAYVDYGRNGDIRLLLGGTVILASLRLFRHDAGEHLVVRLTSKRRDIDRSRAHARLGSARMGSIRNRARFLLPVRVGSR